MEWENLPARSRVMEQLFEQWTAERETERILTEEAIGRVLSEDQFSRNAIPVVRASGMDGVGVRSADFADGIPDTSGWTVGKEFIRADTGDDFDDAYDAVIRIEDVDLDAEGHLTIHPGVTVRPGLGVRPRGSMLREGDRLVPAGQPLRPVDLAALVMGGVTEVPVYRKPRVAFVPTGSELIPAGEPLTRGKNYDSNSILVKHMLLEMGAEPVMFPIVKDDPASLEAALDEAMAQADIVILNGGSSKGDEDYNARMLEKRGTVIAHGVAAAPGKPLCAAVLDNKPVINLPGPPAAVFYSMDWCIRGLVCRWLTIPMPQRPKAPCTLTEGIRWSEGMEILCKMEIRRTEDGYEGRQVPFRGSTVVETLCSNAMYITDPSLSEHRAGETVTVELLQGEEYIG